MVVFQVTVSVELETSLLLHEIAIFLDEVAREDGLALGDLAISALWKQRVRLHSSLLELKGLCLVQKLLDAETRQVAAEVDGGEEGMGFESGHALC